MGRLLPRDEDGIEASKRCGQVRAAARGAQTALDPIARDRVADLLGDGEPDAKRCVRRHPVTQLQHEAATMRPRAVSSGQKIAPLLQPFAYHGR